MNTVLQFLTEHGVMLAVGATILLIAGCATMLTLHAPIKRQRAGEMGIGAKSGFEIKCTLGLGTMECALIPTRSQDAV